MVSRKIALVEAIIKDSRGKILLLKRSKNNKNFVGKWQLPGGKVEFGEDFNSAITREILEEICCKCFALRLEKVAPYAVTFNGAKGKFLLMVFSCKIKGKVLVGDEHSEFKYFFMKKIKPGMLAPSSRRALFS
ncbi:MAG: NUDIX domain-containing protein [archaeon]|jgi:8-oxo-dGTP diphosphatase